MLFRSGPSAQLWFEWRRSGLLLPLSVAAVLVAVVGPVSWLTRTDPGSTAWLLAWTFALPIILAMPVGKGFSKPDFWTGTLALRPFLAVRPLATGEMVVIKLKVAARSTIVSWALVVGFLAAWLPLWANLDGLTSIRVGFWLAYGHSVFPQYAIAALSVLAGMCLTWRFLVGGLWAGLSGSWKIFVAPAAACGLALLLASAGIHVMLSHDAAVRAWLRRDPNRVLAALEWIAALIVIGKFWLAARSWRHISLRRVRGYLLLWAGGTCGLVVLAILLWAHGLLSLQLMGFDLLPLDPVRLRNLLVLLALLIVPFARLGLAPSSLAKNRHRGHT